MPPQDPTPHFDHAAIMGKLGNIEGASNANFSALFAQLNDIRADIRDSEQRTNARIDGVETRVSILEQDNKDQIKSISRQGAVTAAITSAIISGGVEIIKRLAI